ncbi:MAG: alkaline phosphatase family protein [Thaumarchaeota archaeon]|nr:alkaline phosphatase family protein [Nitrososphaerota archaeon]
MKLVYVLLDGVGDRPDKSLNWTTPLEAAVTPNLDHLARNSVSGTVQTVGKDIAPESDIAVFSMLGYDFSSGYVGRGAVEAIGSGLTFKTGDLALRGNFATVNSSGEIIDRRAGRDLEEKEASELASFLNSELDLSNDVQVRLKATVGHRCSVVISSSQEVLSANISNTDPAYLRVKGIGVALENVSKMKIHQSEPTDDNDPRSVLAAQLVNKFSQKCLELLHEHPVNKARRKREKSPANAILLRDASDKKVKLESFYDKFHLKMGALVDMPVEIGIAEMTDIQPFPSFPALTDKAEQVQNILQDFDGVYVHIKGPDEPGHDGDAGLKKRIIEDIDDQFFAQLVKLDSAQTLIVVSADHATPCQLRGHSSDPVPVIFSRLGLSDNTARFTEKETSRGSLGLISGIDVMPSAVKYLE